MTLVYPPRMLKEGGRCCGRKPIAYRRPRPHKFCPRCCADYDAEMGDQIANWAWLPMEGGFTPRHVPSRANKAGDYVILACEAEEWTLPFLGDAQ